MHQGATADEAQSITCPKCGQKLGEIVRGLVVSTLSGRIWRGPLGPGSSIHCKRRHREPEATLYGSPCTGVWRPRAVGADGPLEMSGC